MMTQSQSRARPHLTTKNVVTKEWSIAEKMSWLSWDLNPVCPDKKFNALTSEPKNRLSDAVVRDSLRKHAYSIIQKISLSKTENFQIKISDIFHISAQNIDCGYSLEPPRWGGSNEYPQSMFLSRNKKNNVYPRKLQFYYIKVGFKGVNII